MYRLVTQILQLWLVLCSLNLWRTVLMCSCDYGAKWEKCCDICGDRGVAEVLVTCSQCKINTEHIYCMRMVPEKADKNWRCEECCVSKPPSSCLLEELTDVSKINSPEVCKGGELCGDSRKVLNESRASAGDREKIVATGKTKFISVTEAIKLSSVDNKSFPISPHKERRINRLGKFYTLSRPKAVPRNYSSRQNLPSEPFRPPKPQIPGKMEIRKKQLQQSKKLSEFRSFRSRRPSEALKNNHWVKEQPSGVQFPVTRRSVKQSSLPSANTSPVAISGGDGHNNAIDLSTSGAENRKKVRLLDSEKYSLPLVPALDASWKGSFKIQDGHVQKEINPLLQAHPPSRVRKKVYEFSKQMPEVLHFELVPSRPFSNILFNEDNPDKEDIALYFFPGVGERSEEDYIFLVDKIISTNYALRVQIADLELLVFSSKLLPKNCQCWEGKYFLWGVFRRLKRDNTVPESTVQPSNAVNHDPSQVHDGEEVDMDIDMIGGIEVGRIDIPVQKEPLRVKPTAAMALPESALQITSGQTPAATISLPDVKKEPHDFIPPGFEEVYRLRIQSLFPPVDVVGERDVKNGR